MKHAFLNITAGRKACKVCPYDQWVITPGNQICVKGQVAIEDFAKVIILKTNNIATSHAGEAELQGFFMPLAVKGHKHHVIITGTKNHSILIRNTCAGAIEHIHQASVVKTAIGFQKILNVSFGVNCVPTMHTG